MNISNHIKSIPIWLAPLLFVSTLFIGIYVGSPIAVDYYNLSIPTEVDQLFALMPFVYFYLSIPLCLLCAWGLKLVRKRGSNALSVSYIFICILLVPVIFYGVGVTNYYG